MPGSSGGRWLFFERMTAPPQGLKRLPTEDDQEVIPPKQRLESGLVDGKDALAAENGTLDGGRKTCIGPITGEPKIGPFGAGTRTKRFGFGRGSEGCTTCFVDHAMEDLLPQPQE